MHAWIHEYLLNSVPLDKRGSEKQSQSYHKYISLEEEEEEEDMDGEVEAAVMVSGGVKCGRWNPTAEQVKVLMDLFKAGLRTPSTEEIQSITTHLSSYGKIESKNVFYWFQNHKARERHHKKRRRGATPATSPVLTAPTKREAKSKCLSLCIYIIYLHAWHAFDNIYIYIYVYGDNQLINLFCRS